MNDCSKKSNSEIQVQDNSAQFYQKRYSGFGLKYHFKLITEMMEGIHGKILDVGCGTGILRTLYPSLDIVGLDISKTMLSHYRGNCVWASCEHIPFLDNSFDSIVCRSVLHHLPKTEEALSEMNRVLKPGGKIVFWEPNSSLLTRIVRSLFQRKDRFSKTHTSFRALPDIVSGYFRVCNVKYGGFLGYGLFGFPDICDFSGFWGHFYEPIMALERFLMRSSMAKQGFWVMIKAEK